MKYKAAVSYTLGELWAYIYQINKQTRF